MALMQSRLKLIKSKSAKVVVEKYQDAFDSVVVEISDPRQLQVEVEAYLTAGERVRCCFCYSSNLMLRLSLL